MSLTTKALVETPQQTKVVKRYQAVSYKNPVENRPNHLVYDSEYGPIGDMKDSNVLAACWVKNHAKQIADDMNVATLAGELATELDNLKHKAILMRHRLKQFNCDTPYDWDSVMEAVDKALTAYRDVVKEQEGK